MLAESTQEFGKYEPVMIVSSDKDFKQLHAYENVKQFSPMLKKLITVTSKKELHAWLVEHIVKGDSGDGIPNILSPDNCLLEGVRQKSMRQERLDDFIKNGYAACKTEEERRNWHRNQTLVDFKYIPEDVKNSILEAFEVEPKGNKMAIMNYLIKHKCRLLLDEVEDF